MPERLIYIPPSSEHDDYQGCKGNLLIHLQNNLRPDTIVQDMVEHKDRPDTRFFSDEARENLLAQGYLIYKLSRKSLNDIVKAGYPRVEFVGDYQYIKQVPSLNWEVAINPKNFFYPTSANKTMVQQLLAVDRFSKSIGVKIPGTRAIMGEVPDYLELILSHYNASGTFLAGPDSIFGKNYSDETYRGIRTVTPDAHHALRLQRSDMFEKASWGWKYTEAFTVEYNTDRVGLPANNDDDLKAISHDGYRLRFDNDGKIEAVTKVKMFDEESESIRTGWKSHRIGLKVDVEDIKTNWRYLASAPLIVPA